MAGRPRAQADVRAALAAVLNAPATLARAEPLLAPPLYGAAQAHRDRVDPSVATRWFEQLNLDPCCGRSPASARASCRSSRRR